MSRRHIDSFFRSDGVYPKAKVEVTTFSSVLALVKENIGVSIVDPFTTIVDGCNGVEVLRTRPEFRFVVDFLLPEKTPHSEAIDNYIESAKEVLKQYLSLPHIAKFID